MNYPACTPKDVAVNITEQTNQCQDKCKAAGCVSSSLAKITGVYACSCSNCTQTQKRVCATNATSGVKTPCMVPLYSCKTMLGKPMCVVAAGGKNVWSACGAC